MKVVALIVIFVMLAIFVGLSRPGYRVDPATSAAHDHHESLRGSEAEKTLAQACGNCHSNQTDWPWYSQVAPVSWWIRGHVREGREELNFSEWRNYSAGQRRAKLDSICGVVSTSRMPPWSYTILHPEARLTAEEKKTLCVWARMEIEQDK
jgi:heme-binding protein